MLSGMKRFALVWSPNATIIAHVYARTERAAIRKAPAPYRRYLGEVYALQVVAVVETIAEARACAVA